MKEIGGYLELDKYRLPMLHDRAIALNCGRNCLAYLIRAKQIKHLYIPKFLCNSIAEVCNRENVDVEYYSIGTDFLPKEIVQHNDSWVYIVNYYGQITNDILRKMISKYRNVIIDNIQAYFQAPIEGIDTIYTCRKFFGVSDGAFLYTDVQLNEELEIDESYERIRFLLGRFERSATEFYSEYVKGEEDFCGSPIKKMSKLTNNLLHGIDYEKVKKQRTINFDCLHKELAQINKLNLATPEGAYMYPLYIENGYKIRKALQSWKIYIPTLWPDVFKICNEKSLEYDMAKNILPIPVDQRYTMEDMHYIYEVIQKYIN